MGIQELRKEIEADARKEASRIKEEAEKEAWRIVEKAEEARKKMLEDARLEGEAVAKEEERRISSANLRAKHAVAEAREAAVAGVIDETAAGLKRFAGTKEYARVFHELAEAAVTELGMPREKIFIECRKEDEALAKKLGLPVKTAPCSGGVAAVSADGRIRATNTFEVLLESKRDELKRKAFMGLFGTGGVNQIG